MENLDIKCYFDFWNGGTAEDVIGGVQFSDNLYKKLKKIYQTQQETNLQQFLDSKQLTDQQEYELEGIINKLQKHPICREFRPGPAIEFDGSGKYDHFEFMIDFEIMVPEEWDEAEMIDSQEVSSPNVDEKLIAFVKEHAPNGKLSHEEKLEMAKIIAEAVIQALKEEQSHKK